MYNDLFTIGQLTIHGYGLMIGIGVVCAVLAAQFRAKKKGLSTDSLYSIVGNANLVTKAAFPRMILPLSMVGANALNFELRVFVDMNDRMGVNTDLNARILATLKHHGIEIPFPQMDVHVRDVPAAPASAEPDGKQTGAQAG